jgi:hypothetical protein
MVDAALDEVIAELTVVGEFERGPPGTARRFYRALYQKNLTAAGV